MSEHLHGYYIEDLSVGMSASYAKTVTEADVILFAGITGDDNPVHINEEFAASTMFKGRIVHGMFSAGLISTVLGTRLPGPGCIYVSQQLKFKAPVRIGDTVTATATIKEVNAEKRRVILETVCTVKGRMVLDGESLMMVDSRT
jgi:3-hydroxybutyryl-CoA dehydratase